MDWTSEMSKEQRALEVLIAMTARTLCRRSNSHLEQALQLMECSLSHANLHWTVLVESHNALKAAAAAKEAEAEAKKEVEKAYKELEAAKKEQRDVPQAIAELRTTAAAQSTTPGSQPVTAAAQSTTPGSQPTTAAAQSATPGPQPTTAAAQVTTAATPPSESARAASAAGASSSGQEQQAATPMVVEELDQNENPALVIQTLPEQLLKQLAGLLGRSGLSELAHKRCASVIRMLVEICPQLKPLMLSELQQELQRSAAFTCS